jgi:hypothetical protein
LPLGTGNDLARVLGWGAVLDDDNQLPKLLESFERATTKMLDRWSIMTYDSNNNITTPITCNNSAIPANPTIATSMTASTNNISKSSNNLNANSTIPQLESDSSSFQKLPVDEEKNKILNLSKLEDLIYYHLNNMLQNENISSVIESSIKFNDTLNELLIKVYSLYSEISIHNPLYELTIGSQQFNEEEIRKMNAMTAVVSEQCISLKYFLDDFFLLLKNELKPKLNRIKKVYKDSETSAAFSDESTSSSETDENDDFKNEKYINDNESSPLIFREESDELKKASLNTSPKLGLTLNYTNLCKSNLSLTNRSSTSMGASIITNAVSSANTLTPQDSKLTACFNNQNTNAGINVRSGSCNSSIQRRQGLNSISRLFRHRRKVINRSNHLKALIKQIVKLADKKIVLNKTPTKNQFLTTKNVNKNDYSLNVNDKKSQNVVPLIDIPCYQQHHESNTTTTATNSSPTNNTAPTSNSNSINQDEENLIFNFNNINLLNNSNQNKSVTCHDEDFEDEGYIQNELDLVDENQESNKLINYLELENKISVMNNSKSHNFLETNYKNVNHVSSDHLNTINYQIESKYCYCLYA